MSRSGIARGALAGCLLLAGVLIAAVPAQADSTSAPYTSWDHREDARAPGTDSTYSLPPADSGLIAQSDDENGDVVVYNPTSPDSLGANFAAPAGQKLRAGVTYQAEALGYQGTSTKLGELMLSSGGTMCGRTQDQLYSGYEPVTPATGWFHVSELEYDAAGSVVRFAATYEMNCQYLDGPAGFEGSVAVNATQPAAPVPDAPETPGPVTGLTATNVGPDSGGVNTSTLHWANPAGFDGVNIDMVQSSDATKLPDQIATYGDQQYRGRSSSYYAGNVDFMDTRTYRVVPLGSTGRLGPASLLTVMGTRLATDQTKQTIMIGQPATFHGRLSQSWDYVNPADVMNGPAMPGRTLLMCEQTGSTPDSAGCNPVDHATTGADGRFTLSVSPVANAYYNIMLRPTSRMLGNWSYVISAMVAPQTDLRTQQAASARTASVRRGSVIHFTTSRARRGSLGIIRLQRLGGHSWHTIVTKRLGHGTARLGIGYREWARGLHSYRVVKLGDARHVNGHSRTVHVQVN